MKRIKANITVDKELWEEFRRYSTALNMDTARLLEDAIKDVMVYNELDDLIGRDVEKVDEQVDFEPIRAMGSVSELVRLGRDGRRDSIP
ncbi:MAG: hypothetical protein NZ888_00820 [Candidatus Nitrosocaldus sp.]|nr:hypothetical protein [Candidatus Nitrosocaldus sp.]MDW7999472.1 hypothetical protein [Candidatus Nitrosocaldus sp.]